MPSVTRCQNRFARSLRSCWSISHAPNLAREESAAILMFAEVNPDIDAQSAGSAYRLSTLEHPLRIPDSGSSASSSPMKQLRRSSAARQLHLSLSHNQGGVMQPLLQDLRYALRQFRNAPGFTLVAVLTLALGIGANTAIYSVIHGALRLPYPNAEHMVAIKNVYPQGSYAAVSYPDFEDWQARVKSFSHFAARFNGQMTWLGKGEPQTVNVGYASRDYFSLFSMQRLAGRTFLPPEHVKAAAAVCMLSETFWREQFGRGQSAIGRPLNLDGRSCTV